MFGLCFRLALTNLKKNRRLYYPYAIMTIVSTAISYIFASLAFHPDLGQVKGANGVTQVLGFGMIVFCHEASVRRVRCLYYSGFGEKTPSFDDFPRKCGLLN